MTPNRKEWPLQYRVLARLAMGALALLVMGYLFILHPTRARLERQKAEIERKTDYLKGMQLPLDSVLLGERLRDAMRMLEGDDEEDMTSTAPQGWIQRTSRNGSSRSSERATRNSSE